MVARGRPPRSPRIVLYRIVTRAVVRMAGIRSSASFKRNGGSVSESVSTTKGRDDGEAMPTDGGTPEGCRREEGLKQRGKSKEMLVSFGSRTAEAKLRFMGKDPNRWYSPRAISPCLSQPS